MKLFATLLIIFFTNPVFSQVNLNRGLLAYYPFTNNADDASGNKNKGIVYNATLTVDKDGKPNSAYHFNGYNAFIKVPNSSSLQPGHQISICAQLKVTGFYKGRCYNNTVVMKGNEEYVPNNFFMRYTDIVNGCNSNADTRKEQFFSGSDQYAGVATSPVTTGHWYSLVCTYDGTDFRIYVDCVLQNVSAAIKGLSFDNTDPMMLGRTLLDGYPYYINGDMDEIRIYNRALNVEEVKVYSNCPVKNIKDSAAKKQIDLISFAATPSRDNKYISLKWSAVNEYAGKYIIERNTKDSADYQVVCTQPMRQTPGINIYSFYDHKVIPNIVYEYEIHYLAADKLHHPKRKNNKQSVSAKLQRKQ